jgi:hypothetical protein
MTEQFRSGAYLRLKKTADSLEAELRRASHSHPLLFKAGRELTAELDRYLGRLEAMEVCGAASEVSPCIRDLIRQCHEMIECATLILHA